MAVEGIFRGECKRIYFTPTSDIPCGTFVIVGGIVGVTTSAVAANTRGEIQIDGDYEVRFDTAKTIVAGALVLTTVYSYTKTAYAGVPVGVALESGSNVKQAKIKLLPFYLAQHAKVYDPSRTYAVGDVVIYSSKFYVCKTAVTTPESWASSKWTALTNAPSTLPVLG